MTGTFLRKGKFVHREGTQRGQRAMGRYKSKLE
jgi:hypothetical protein